MEWPVGLVGRAKECCTMSLHCQQKLQFTYYHHFPAKIWEMHTQWTCTVNAHDDCLTFTKFKVASGSPHVGEKLLRYDHLRHFLQLGRFLTVDASTEIEQDKHHSTRPNFMNLQCWQKNRQDDLSINTWKLIESSIDIPQLGEYWCLKMPGGPSFSVDSFGNEAIKGLDNIDAWGWQGALPFVDCLVAMLSKVRGY